MRFLFRWIPRVIVIVIALFLVISAFSYFLRSSEPPSVEDAPWVIQTYSVDEFRLPSRYYYAESVEYISGAPVAKGHWWDFDGKNYHKHSEDRLFSLDEYGKVDIRRR